MKHVREADHNSQLRVRTFGHWVPVKKRLVVMLGLALASSSVDVFAQTNVSAPAGGGDITGLVQADNGSDDITLQGGAYSVTLPSGTTTYNGVLSGTGTLSVSGAGNTLVLTGANTFNLPNATETVVDEGYYPGNSATYEGISPTDTFHGWIYDVVNTNAPAVQIATGATLDLAAAAQTGTTAPPTGSLGGSFGSNFVNIQNDGTLVVDGNNDGSELQIESISGSGVLHLVSGVLYLPTVNTYTGATIIENNQTLDLGTDHSYGAIPDSSFVFNNGSFILDTPINDGSGNPGVMTVTQNVWESHWGNDININPYGGLIVLSGVYSYTNSGATAETDPSLSNPSLNYTIVTGGSTTRGFNIEGGIVQFGDGTTDKIFLPGNEYTSYINLHNGGILAFDYDGTVTLDTPIGGGQYHDSTSTPGIGSVVITGNASNANHVIFTQPGDYNGLTQIDAGTILQLGDGTAGNSTGTPGQVGYFSSSRGDSSLLTAESSDGLSTDRVLDNGTLIVDNVVGAQDGITSVSLSNISGSGGLTQIGALPLTLFENTTYTGVTTIGAGSTLYLGTNSSGVAGSIASSSSVNLTGAGATLDISQATAETLQDLNGAAGSIVALGSHALTVGTADSTVFAGAITDGGIAGGTGGSLIKVGSGTLALTGTNTYTGGTTITAGVLQLGMSSTSGSVVGNILDNATLAFDHSDTFTYDGVISGSGAVVQAGSGTTVLSNNSSYTGTTTISAGALQLDGDIDSDVIVGTAGQLTGTGQAGSLTVDGTLRPGDTAGVEATFKVSHSVTFAAGSIFAVNVDAGGGHSLLQTTGATTLLGGNVSVTVANGTYQAKQEYLILSAAGGVSGTFSSVLVNGLNLDPTLRYTADDVYLDLLNPATTSTSGGTNPGGGTVSLASGLMPLFSCTQLTANQCSVEHALQSASSQSSTSLQPVLEALTEQPLASGRTALTSLDGEIYADADLLAAHQIADLRTLLGTHSLEDGHGAWVDYVDGDTNFSGNGNVTDLSSHNDDVYAGLEGALGDQLQLGLFAGTARSNATLASGGDYATLSGPQAGIYAKAVFGATDAWYGNAIVGVGNPKVAVYRFPNIGGEIAYVSGTNYHEHTAGLSAEFGYRAEVAGVDMRPFVAYDGGLAQRSTVSETDGAPTDLQLHGQRTIASAATVGLHASHSFVTSSGLGVTPDFTVGVTRRLRADGTVVDATLPAAPASFDTSSVRTGRMLATASGGVRLRFARNVSLSLDGAYGHAQHENDRNIQAKVAVAW